MVRQIAMVSETKSVAMSDLSQASAAYQKQVTRDFGPLWDVSATIDVFDKLENVPLGYWPIILRDDIHAPGAGGYHTDDHGQPFALVHANVPTSTWQLTASHECLEMLADPGDSPKPDQGRVEFLVEVCDPSEATRFAYTVNGVLVSDFYTPHYFDPLVAPGVRYSYKGFILQPRQVLEGGYLSWHEPVSDHWWQKVVGSGGSERFRDLGILQASRGSIRGQIDRMSEGHTADALRTDDVAPRHFGLQLAEISPSTDARAARLHKQIEQIIGNV